MAKQNDSRQKNPGRFSYAGLERVIHEKARLGILTSLAAKPEGLLFTELKDLCTLTDGNLSRHLKVLQEANLVEVWKRFQHNRPQTLCRMTREGRERFLEYIHVLETVVADAVGTVDTRPLRHGSGPPLEGWSPA